MKCLRLFPLLLLLSACVGPDLMPPPMGPGVGGLPPAPPPEPPRYTPPGHSDYLPHLCDEYRSGYDIGRTDASYGYPRDPRRAYLRYGHGYESYFQEGYGDGYDGRRMMH